MRHTENRELRLVRTVKAPIDLVWQVWTDPEHIIQWWGPNGFTTTIHQMDFREGGEWRLTMQDIDGKRYPNRSIFRGIIPFNKIIFEHFNPHFMTNVLFEARGGDTRIEWSALFDTAEDLEIVIKTFNAREGQKQNFERLERYLKQKNENEKQFAICLFGQQRKQHDKCQASICSQT